MVIMWKSGLDQRSLPIKLDMVNHSIEIFREHFCVKVRKIHKRAHVVMGTQFMVILLYKEQQLDDDEYLIDCGCNADEENCITAIKVKSDGSIFGIPLETSNIISAFKRRQGLLAEIMDDVKPQTELSINIGEENPYDTKNHVINRCDENKIDNLDDNLMRYIEKDLKVEIEIPSQSLVETEK